MNRNYQVVLVILVIIIGLASGYMLFSDSNVQNQNNTTNNTDNIETTAFTGINKNRGDLTVDSEELVNAHTQSISKLSSYNMLLNFSFLGSKEITKDENELLMIESHPRSKNTYVYRRDGYEYRRVGGIAGNYKTQDATEESYYPSENLKSLISNSQVKEYNQSNSSIRVEMNATDTDKLANILNYSQISDYNLTFRLTNQGIITNVDLNYVGTINNYTETESRYYIVRDINETEFQEPSWINRATGLNPVLNISHSDGRISITNVEGRRITNQTTIELSRGIDNTISSELGYILDVNETIYITEITEDSLSITKDSSIDGNINTDEISRIVVREGNTRMYNGELSK